MSSSLFFSSSMKTCSAFVWNGELVTMEKLRLNGVPLMESVVRSPWRSSFWIAHCDSRLTPSPASTDSLIGWVLLNCMMRFG